MKTANEKKETTDSSLSLEVMKQRIKRHLPPLVNLELLVLKGHLLIEEQLQTFLEAISSDPAPLESAHLSFHQKACLVQAMTGLRRTSTGKFILQLNTLRNRFAHRLEAGDASLLVDDLLRKHWEEDFHAPISSRQRASELRRTLITVLAVLSGQLVAFAMLRASQRKSIRIE